MYNIYLKYSAQWFPWVKDDSWTLLTTLDTMLRAQEYIKTYGDAAHEYKIELAADSDSVGNTSA